MDMPPSPMGVPMDRAYTRYMITAKMGSASMRLVTILSILSEEFSACACFFLYIPLSICAMYT